MTSGGGSVSYTGGIYAPDNSSQYTPEIHFSYGQSWRSNIFDSFASPFSLNPNGPIPLLTNSIGAPNFAPGPLANSAGISLPGTITGITNYSSSDVFSIGRCAILAQQLLRIASGSKVLVPIIEFCCAYPGSTWTTGAGGGLGPGSSFTASVTNDLMTVTAVASGALAVGQIVTAAGITAGTYIVGLGTGTGNTGTYNIGIAQTVVSEAMTSATPGAASFVASIGGGSPSMIMTVTSVVSGTLQVGQTVTGANVKASTTIASQSSGSAGGTGTYVLEVGSPQNVASESMVSTATSWTNMLTIQSAIKTAFPFGKASAPVYKSMGYTQGGSTTDTVVAKIADLTAMLTAYDALGLPGPSQNYYLGAAAAISNGTVYSPSEYGTTVFCRTNAPGQGGTWSGRCFASTPWYPWPFDGVSNIHTNDYGTVRHGEIEGYIRYQVQDKGLAWTPLWRSLTGSIVVSGQTITIPFDRPSGSDFASGVLSFQSNANDGIKTWSNQGFNVIRSAAFLTITNVVISGMSIVLTISETLHAGDNLEVSYAFYGPGGANPGPCSGVGGNLAMDGPLSVLFPSGYQGVTKFVTAWAFPFDETITV